MKTVFLLSACVASIALSFGSPKSDTSRRSSQQEDVFASLAAIKAAIAALEKSLTKGINISQEEVNVLVKTTYSKATKAMKDHEDLPEIDKERMAEYARVGGSIQSTLNPRQAIFNALAPQFLRICGGADVMRLTHMIDVAVKASDALVKKHQRAIKLKTNKEHIGKLKALQETVDNSVSERVSNMMYDKTKPKGETGDPYHVSKVGQSLVNTFSQEFEKLGLKRQHAVKEDGSLVVLDPKTQVVQGSPEDDAVTHILEIVKALGTNQLSLARLGICVNFMTLFKSGVTVPVGDGRQYYAIQGKKVLQATLQEGRYSFDKEADPVHTLTEQELMTLTANVELLLRAALARASFKSPKLIAMRKALGVKIVLPAAEDDIVEGSQTVTEFEGTE